MKLKKFNFKIINSTNDRAFHIIKNTNNKSGIVIAEKQIRGRGQYGKKWTSFKGNLFVSIFFPVNMVKYRKVFFKLFNIEFSIASIGNFLLI